MQGDVLVSLWDYLGEGDKCPFPLTSLWQLPDCCWMQRSHLAASASVAAEQLRIGLPMICDELLNLRMPFKSLGCIL